MTYGGWVFSALVTLAMVAAACGSDDPIARSPTITAAPTDTVAPAATATLAPSPTPNATAAPATRTGVASVDHAIAAIEAGDVDALLHQVALEKAPCVGPDDVQPLDWRPRCGSGEATGDLVDKFETARCEGYAIPAWDENAIRRVIEGFFGEPLRFYGAYRFPEGMWSGGIYMALFYPPPPFRGTTYVALLNNEGLAGAANGCSATPEYLGAVKGALPLRADSGAMR